MYIFFGSRHYSILLKFFESCTLFQCRMPKLFWLFHCFGLLLNNLKRKQKKWVPSIVNYCNGWAHFVCIENLDEKKQQNKWILIQNRIWTSGWLDFYIIFIAQTIGNLLLFSHATMKTMLIAWYSMWSCQFLTNTVLAFIWIHSLFRESFWNSSS